MQYRLMHRRALLMAPALAAVSWMGAHTTTASASDLQSALSGGKPSIAWQLRYEDVAQDNAAKDADALTSRLRLGYGTDVWNDFDAYVEYEGIAAVSGDGGYNSGPPFLDATNGNTDFSVIAEPVGDEVNQAWLRYQGPAGTDIKVGRQRIILDNARFVGNIGWRSNEQTFDAISLSNDVLPDITLSYRFVWEQNFIFFNQNKLRAHLANAHWQPADWLHLTGYGYFIDFDDDQGARVPGAPDHRVVGLRATGAYGYLGYALEYADQAEHADAPDVVDAQYLHAALSLKRFAVTPTIAVEVLGGDGDYGFQFPFATNHKFQGWADLFLVTPSAGVVDLYAKLAATVAGTRLTAVYHDFRADEGDADYGNELDLAAAYSVTDQVSLLAKFADYSSDGFAVDTRRYWLQAAWRF